MTDNILKYEIVVDKCPICQGKWKYYHGVAGYESLQCEKCRFDIQEIKVIAKK